MPPSVLLLTLTPNSDVDRERLARALPQLAGEDPALAIVSSAGPTVTIGAAGEQHLEIVVDRLRREFSVAASVDTPRVAYREAIRGTGDAERKCARPIGGRGQDAHVRVRVSPAPAWSGCAFAEHLGPDRLPDRLVEAIRGAVHEAAATGIATSHPLDACVELCGGSYDVADSSPDDFRQAATDALRDAVRQAQSLIIEPVMRIEIQTTAEWMPIVLNAITARARRPRPIVESGGPARTIRAHLPLARLIGVAAELRDRTGGRASTTMTLATYWESNDDRDGDDGSSPVREPLRPRPHPRISAVAVPEPSDDLRDF